MPLKALRRKSLTNDPGYLAAQKNVRRALGTVRKHLDMDVAFISEFIGDKQLFHHVDSRDAQAPVCVGQTLPLAEGYCKKIVDGALPELIPNTADVPLARTIPATSQIPIGSHLSVPLRLSDGHIYGTFCCFSFGEREDLNERDLAMMKAFAELVAYQIDTEVSGIRDRVRIFDRIAAVLKSDQPAMVYQPLYGLVDRRLLGVEALARFEAAPQRTPDVWFAEAREINLQADLELAAIRNAIKGFAPAWHSGAYYLSLNASPATVTDPRLADTLNDVPADRIVLEITEHCHVDSYTDLIRALDPLRARGVKIAVDDAGSGYASMRHVLNIRPDIIKLDVSLTREIDTDLTRLALARALCTFGSQTGSKLVAEGIETEAQLQTLRRIGVHAGQGYFLGRPMPFEQFQRLLPEASEVASKTEQSAVRLSKAG